MDAANLPRYHARMHTFRLEHEIPCSEKEFWNVFLNRDFNERLFRTEIGFHEFDIVEQTETDRDLIRICHARPKIPLLQDLGARLMGKRFRFVEHGRFDKAEKHWTWRLTASVMPDKFSNEGSVRVEPRGDKCLRIVEVRLEARTLLGSMLEKSAEKRIRDGWNGSARFMSEWLLPRRGSS